MSDPLTRLHEVAAKLLGVVDETLARSGAPAHHRVWPLLRSVGLLPGDAVAAVEALSWEAFRQRTDLMRSQRERAEGLDDLLRPPSGWEGAAAEAAGARLVSARAGVRVLATNAGVLADVLGELTEWGVQGRSRLARTLAKVLTSAQAIELTVEETEPVERARAAADIGAEVLDEVMRFWAGARDVAGEGLGRLEAEPVRDGHAAETSVTDRIVVEF